MEATLIGPTGRTNLGSTALTIGRLPNNQLVMSDPQSSSNHAEIHPEGQIYSIIDKGSRNGTFVNEERLLPNVPRPLNNGDRIRIGTTVFTYEVRGAPAISPYAASPGQGNEPTIPPTVAVPPPIFSGYGYGPTPQNNVQPPPQFPQPPQAAYQPQPVYAPPPQYAPPIQPPYNAPAPARKKSRLWLWLTLGLVGLLVICGIAGFAIAYANRSTPTKTLTAFCTDLKNGDDHDAYQQLSSNVQSRESESKFTSALQRAGGVRDCTFGSVTENSSTANAIVTVVVNVTIVPPITKNTRLIVENGNWKIDTVPV